MNAVPTTHWSVVLQARHGTEATAVRALDTLCRAYWYPLYAYVRRRGHDEADAQDLTQEFFHRLLKGDWLAQADPERGRFRSFLLGAMNHFLANEWRRGQTVKRGGGVTVLSLDEQNAEGRYLREPAHEQSPERLYDRRWALTLLERTMKQLENECAESGRAALFGELKAMLSGDSEKQPFAAVAARLGTTEDAIKKAAQRLRDRYRELLRTEIAQTVSRPEEVDKEIRHLFAALRDTS